MPKSLQYIIITILISAGVIGLGWWLVSDPTGEFTVSSPGMDEVGIITDELVKVKIGEFFKSFSHIPDEISESWPRFRGSDFDNISKSDVKLLDKFPEEGPPIVWQHELGEGHAGAAIYNGLVYLLDYDESERSDMLRCFNLESGEEVWRRWYKVGIKRNHGISRTVPAVTDDYILTIGPKCHVMCVERRNGDFLWGIDIEKEYNSEIPLWYTGQCPLIDNDIAIIATGGNSLIVGIDCTTGEIIWETPNPGKWKMSHASIIPFEFAGTKMYVYPAIGGICGISAEDRDVGTILWETSEWEPNVVAPSAVCMPDGKIFLTAGYGAGSIILKLSEVEGKFNVQLLDQYKPALGLASEQQTVISRDGHLFGILPKDAGPRRNQFVCINPDNCREMVWTSGKTNRFGLGPYLVADNKFWLLNDDGTLVIIKASTKEYKELDRYKILDGHDAWAPMALANGLLVLRDSKTLICLDVNRN